MIQSILDNDLYKFTMQQAVHMLYPRAQARYELINRGRTPFPEGIAEKVREEIKKMKGLFLTPDQRAFLEKACYFLTPVYLDFLESYRFDPDEVEIRQENGTLNLSIQGPWYRTILWEVPLMAIISETYFKLTEPDVISDPARQALNRKKAETLRAHNIKFADFGTRRRFSASNQESLIRDILSLDGHTMIGTSNVHYAHTFGLTPIGTLAHEWFMFHAVLHGYQMANPAAQDAWVRVFHGDLGIALTDTYTTDVFLSTFDTFHAKLFDGVRQDSGDPLTFTDKLVAHYKKHHIDPSSKTIVFSDGLDVKRAIQVHDHCRGRVRDAYGIGTSLTNDVGAVPLNMVIKLTRCRVSAQRPWQSTVKLSDDKGKHTGDPDELRQCMERFNLL